MQAARPDHARAFSLVELSIVLVILGLLTGGILAGQSLIRAAELRKVGTDINRFQAAIHTFRDKYFALPGDMDNAKSFWPTATNGVRDNRIYWSTEGPNFWNHLQQAGLIEGNIAPFTGTATQISIGTHVPRCPLSTCGYSMVHFGAWTLQPHLEMRNILGMGAERTNTWTADGVSGFFAEELWGIDKKFDDGHPDMGKIAARWCVTGSYPDRTYLLQDRSTACALLADLLS